MSKTKKIISLVLAALLIMAMATVAVSAMSADEVHVVAGAPELCGSNWDPADTNNQMTYNAEKDIYEKVFTGVAAGTYDFKVTTNYGWDNGDFNLTGDAMYGGPNATVTVDADGSTVIVGFNGMHATVEVVAGTDTPVEPTTVAGGDVEPTTAAGDDTPVVGDTITFYFTNNKGWATVNAHTWDSNGALDAGWPGAAMTFVETNEFGEDIYSITVPASATGVVFNAGEGQAQTTDVAPENGKGYYCVEQDAEGKWTVESYDYIVVDPTTAGGDVEPTTVAGGDVEPTTVAGGDVEPTTVAGGDVEPTTVPGTDTPVTGDGAKVEGVAVGDEIVYTYTLKTPAAIENVQATTYYDATKLELVAGTAREMFPVLRDITSVVYNTDIAGEVKFNATEGVEEGFDFTEGGILVTLKFKVLDASVSEVNTVIEEMVKFGEKVDYATNGEIVAEGVETEQTITGGSAPVTSSTETEPTTVPTTPTTVPTKPVEGNGVTVGGIEYGVSVDDVITYTYVLTTPAPIENVQATTYYDATKLQLIEGKAKEMFPVLRDITSVVYNTEIPGEVKFNATEGVEEGFDFTQGGVLVTLQFKVLDTTPSEIYTIIEEMVKFGEKVDYATGGQIVADGVTGVETLTGNTPPATQGTTVTEPTEGTTVTEPTEGTTVTEPTEGTTVTEPTEGTTVTEPTEGTTATEPTEGTTAGKPATDPTSKTEAGTTAPKTDAPATGAAAYIYVVVAVLAMAACAVVVLRKRVNG